jgi:hypothetical protein
MANHFGTIEFSLQSHSARAEIIQAVEQMLQTLQIKTGDGERRCAGHGAGISPLRIVKKAKPHHEDGVLQVVG